MLTSNVSCKLSLDLLFRCLFICLVQFWLGINYGRFYCEKVLSKGGRREFRVRRDRKYHSHVYRFERTEQGIQRVQISCGNSGNISNESLKVWLFCTWTCVHLCTETTSRGCPQVDSCMSVYRNSDGYRHINLRWIQLNKPIQFDVSTQFHFLAHYSVKMVSVF